MSPWAPTGNHHIPNRYRTLKLFLSIHVNWVMLSFCMFFLTFYCSLKQNLFVSFASLIKKNLNFGFKFFSLLELNSSIKDVECALQCEKMFSLVVSHIKKEKKSSSLIASYQKFTIHSNTIIAQHKIIPCSFTKRDQAEKGDRRNQFNTGSTFRLTLWI